MLVAATTTTTSNAIRPFKIDIPEAAVTDLRQRVLATRWPQRETVNDQSQGVKLHQITDVSPNGAFTLLNSN